MYNRKTAQAARKKQGLCIFCGKFPPKENRNGCEKCLNDRSKNNIKYSKLHPDRITNYRNNIRNYVLNKYGGACVCCGEKQLLFLTIDHKNNDGYQDRINLSSPMGRLLKLKREPIRTDLQIACFNCNLGRELNNGICPHKLNNDDDIIKARIKRH